MDNVSFCKLIRRRVIIHLMSSCRMNFFAYMGIHALFNMTNWDENFVHLQGTIFFFPNV